MLLMLLMLRKEAKQAAEVAVSKTGHFLTGLMVLLLLMLRAGAEQAAEATVAKHYSFPDKTVVAVVAEVASRDRAGIRGNCCKTLFIS